LKSLVLLQIILSGTLGSFHLVASGIDGIEMGYNFDVSTRM
jgi:hypothetical protein